MGKNANKPQTEPEMVAAVRNTVDQLERKFTADLTQQLRRLVEATPDEEVILDLEPAHPRAKRIHITTNPEAELIQHTVTITNEKREEVKPEDLGYQTLLEIINLF